MISEKKFNLEIGKRDNIIKQLRQDRNKITVEYQKLNSDFINFIKKVEGVFEKKGNEDFIKEFDNIVQQFKNYF